MLFINKYVSTVIGKFKDECKGNLIEEFIGLRSKLYTYVTFDNKVNKKFVVDKSINCNDYKEYFNNTITEERKQTNATISSETIFNRNNVY